MLETCSKINSVEMHSEAVMVRVEEFETGLMGSVLK